MSSDHTPPTITITSPGKISGARRFSSDSSPIDFYVTSDYAISPESLTSTVSGCNIAFVKCDTDDAGNSRCLLTCNGPFERQISVTVPPAFVFDELGRGNVETVAFVIIRGEWKMLEYSRPAIQSHRMEASSHSCPDSIECR